MQSRKEITDAVHDVDERYKHIASIEDWWESGHRMNESILLSGYAGKDVWKALDVLDEVTVGKRILNIGVGMGYCTNDMVKQGAIVHALDISTTALKKVEHITERTWLPQQLPELPNGYFDLAVSHLVAQHMSDADLIHQIKHVLPGLKRGGFFAIQIANSRKPDYEYSDDLYNQKWGAVLRTVDKVQQIIAEANGSVAWMELIGSFPQYGAGWYGVHIIKNAPGELEAYHAARLAKKMSRISEADGDFYLQSGVVGKAFDQYVMSADHDPNNRTVQRKIAEVLYHQGKKTQSLETFMKLHRGDRSNTDLLVWIGQILIELGKPVRAYEVFIEFLQELSIQHSLPAVTGHPLVKDGLEAFGDVCFSAELPMLSNSIYRVAAPLFPAGYFDSRSDQEHRITESQPLTLSETEIKLNLARLAMETSRTEIANALLTSVLNTDRENVAALIDFGVLSVMEQKIEQADTYFLQALELDPENEIALENHRYTSRSLREEQLHTA